VPPTREFAERHGIPEEAAAGGAATALPEYMAKLPSLPMVEPKGDPNEGFGPPPAGSLRVVTSNLSGGWLRRNGVPYSEKTTVTEFFDRFPGPDGSEWFVVTTQVVDPEYLLGRLVTSSHFRREPDDSK
jgi:hypothetical protein